MDNVLYCKIDDCNILKEKILLIFNDKMKKFLYNRKRKNLVDKYKWNNIIIKLIKVMENR